MVSVNPGSNDIDPDIVRAAFQRKSLGHLDDGALGDGINAALVSRPDPVDGRHVDDGTAAVFLHQPARIGGHEEIAAYIDFNGFSERARISFRDVAVIGVCRGIVDQYVQPAMLMPYMIKNCLDLFHVADMAGISSRLAACSLELCSFLVYELSK